MNKFEVGQHLVVTYGKFRGMAGVVTACEDRANTVWLSINSFLADQLINKNLSFSFNHVRVL